MNIRFPKQRMADRVVSRILAASRLTETQRQSMALNARLMQQPEPMAAPEGIEDAIVGKALDL